MIVTEKGISVLPKAAAVALLTRMSNEGAPLISGTGPSTLAQTDLLSDVVILTIVPGKTSFNKA